jgi:type II secretory pathway component GspD/PulD (secretin)
MYERLCLGVVAVFFSLLPLQAQQDHPQVRIEACVLEWQHSGSLNVDFAIAYQRDPGSGSNVGEAGLATVSDQPLGSAARLFFDKLDTTAGSFDAVIEALEGAGSVHILSRPYNVVTSAEIPESEFGNMKTDPAYTATLSNETEIPYESAKAVGQGLVSVTEYQKAGVTLVVSVQKVIDNQLILLTMDTNVSDVTGFVNVGLNARNEPMRVPTLDRRSIKSRLIVADGKVFIAGLMKTTQQVEQRRGIPWLGELPLLKYIFSSTRTITVDKELVFLVKARILTPYKAYFPPVAEDDA